MIDAPKPRTVIITGAGGGLGRALVRAVAGRGHRAVAFGREIDRLREAGAGIDPALFEAHIADAGDFGAIDHAVAAVAAAHGRIDGVFANAAIYPRTSLADASAAEWMETMRVNVGGVVALVRAVLPHMMRTTHGRIVTLGSFAYMHPIPDSSAYSTSKGAISTLTRAIAAEVGSDYPDILVNEWVPGGLKTTMGIPDGIDPDVAAGWGAALLDLPPGGPTGRIFDREHLVEPPKSLKQKVLGKIGLG